MAMDKYSKLVLEFDKVTGAMKFAGQETVSLQKQVRLLRQELTLGTYTQEEFSKIQNALAETEFKLKQSQLRGKDLFEQIGTLGGGFGEMSNRIDRAIKLFNALNNVTFDELKDKFRNLAALISGDVESISEEIQVIQQPGGRPTGMRELTGNAGEAGDALRGATSTVTAAAAVSASASAIQGLSELERAQQEVVVGNVEILGSWNRLQAAIKSGVPLKDFFVAGEELSDDVKQFKNWAIANENLLPTIMNLRERYQDWIFTVQEGNILVGLNDKALRKLTDAELALLGTTEALTISNQGYIISQQQAELADKKAAAAKALNNTLSKIFIGTLNILRAVTIAYSTAVEVGAKILSLGFTPALKAATVAVQLLYAALAGIVGFGLGMLGPAIKEWITGFAQMSAEAETLSVELNNISKILEMDLKDTKRRGAEKIAEMKKNNATSKQIRDEELKQLKEQLVNTNAALDDARKKEQEANEAISKAGGVFGIDDKAAEKMAQNVKDAGDIRLKLEEEQADLISEINVKGNANIDADKRESIQNRIKMLDASIENEIYSEKTRTGELERLYAERNSLTEYLDKDHKLKQSERDERNRIQRKKINDAIIEDEVRTSEEVIKNLENRIIDAGEKTDEEFNLRRQIIDQNFIKEMAEARKDERTREENERNAYTKLIKSIKELEKEKLEARKQLTQSYYNAAAQDTEQFFNLERQILEDELAIQLVIYENNEKMKLALKEEYAKKLREVDAKQLDAQGNLEQRRADTEWHNMDNRGKVGLKWLFSHNNKVREINDLVYQDKLAEEEKRYEADKTRAQGNAQLLEVIEREHLQRMTQLRAEQVETNQQLNQMMFQTAIQFGETLGQLGDLLLSRAQGRNKKQFENAKKLAIGAVVIEKAAAIGQIWSNNAIANAKATATFWATGGQPWVTINTIQAGLSTAATVLSAAKAIQEINGRQFEPTPTTMGKNYEKGGMIGGNRHYEGGTMIEAEQGEAIMSRGAVTMFAPLLSTLNQMGGGTAFSRGAVGQAGYDNPDFSLNNNNNTPSQIIKTYVVENELTSVQEKQARLRNLSTL